MNQHNQEHDVQNIAYAVIMLHLQLRYKFSVSMDRLVFFSVIFKPLKIIYVYELFNIWTILMPKNKTLKKPLELLFTFSLIKNARIYE